MVRHRIGKGKNCQFIVSYVFLILVNDIIGYTYWYGGVTRYFITWIRNNGINVRSWSGNTILYQLRITE